MTGTSDNKQSDVLPRHLGSAKFHSAREEHAVCCPVDTRNMFVIAPPWGCLKHFEVALFPWPSRDVHAKVHGNSTFCAWVEAFRAERSNLQTLAANGSQSGRSMHNLKDPFRLLPMEMLCTYLDDFWSKNVHKCVLDTSACWWRYNRPMWKITVRGTSVAPRECACNVSLQSYQRCLSFAVHKHAVCYSATMRPIWIFWSAISSLA